MSKSDIHNHFSNLATKYLSGNASPAEVEELENWVLAAPENKKQFISIKKAWMLSGMQQDSSKVNLDEIWETTSEQLTEKTKMVQMRPRNSRRRWIGIAAATTFLAIASFLFFLNLGSNSPTFVEAKTESKTFDLSDGSEITLNQTSSLSFLDNKETGQREVDLKGDAFFDVARDVEKPFIIKTQNVEIEVLGTSFYVDAREGQDEIQVIVESGKVAVRSGGNERILVANEKVIFQKNNKQLTKEENQDPNFSSLKTKTLVFENTKMEDVAFALNRQFNVNVTFENEALKDCELDSTFPNMSLDAILKIMDASFGIQSKRNGKDIELSGTCIKN